MPVKATAAEASVVSRLDQLNTLAVSGFAIPLHFRYQTPTYLFQTYPVAWTEAYSREGLVLRDPVIRWALGHLGVTTWAELEADDPAGVLALARTYGLAYGMAVSLDRNGSRSMASLARPDRPFTPDETGEIIRATEHLHDLTASVAPLSAATRSELRRLSVAFTHP